MAFYDAGDHSKVEGCEANSSRWYSTRSSNLRKVFNRLLTAAKLRRVRFHDLRHIFATLLIEQGESLAYIRDQLGHSSIKITVDTYGHLVPGGNRQAVDKPDERVTVKADQEAATA